MMKYVVVVVAVLACFASASVLTPKGILPPIESPMQVNATNFTADSPLMKGEAGLDECWVHGLDKLEDTFFFNLITLVLRGNLNLPWVNILANYFAQAEIYLSNGTNIVVTGKGELDFAADFLSVTDARIAFRVNLVTGKISVDNVDALAVSLLGCVIVTTGDSANGNPIDWVETCKSASGPDGFIAQFWPIHKVPFCEEIKDLANEVIGDLTLQDLIDIIGGSGGSRGLY